MPNIGIRSLDAAVSERFTTGAKLRGLTLAQYLAKLLELHDRIKEGATPPNEDYDIRAYAANVLEDLELTPITKSA